MDLNNQDKYRAEARRKIAEADKRRRQAAASQNQQAKPKSDPSNSSGQKSGIETWDGLNTRPQQGAPRKQNPKSAAKPRREQPQGASSRQAGTGASRQAGSTVSRQAGSGAAAGKAQNARPSGQARSGNPERSRVRLEQQKTSGSKGRERQQPRGAEAGAVDAHSPRHEKAALNARLRKIQQRRNRSRTIMLSIVVVLALTVTGTLIYLLMNQRDTNANLQFIYEGSVTESYSAPALIVRDEITVTATAGGTLLPVVPEGYYVRVGEETAMIIGQDMNTILTELENYRRQISDVQLEMIAEGKVEGAAVVYSDADKDLHPLVSDLRHMVASNQFGGIDGQMEQIETVLQERTDRLSDILYDNAILDTLNAEKAVLEQQLAVNSEVVKSSKAGLISFATDGLESELNSARMSRITSEEVTEYIAQNDRLAALPREVINGQVIMRQVTGIDQYFAMLVPDLSYGFFTDRSTVNIYIPSEDLRIDKIEIVTVEPRVGAVYLILKTDKAVARLLDERTVQIEVIANEMKGLRVPMSALRRDEDDLSSQTTMIIVSEGYYREIEVMVKASNGSFAIVESLDEEVTLRQGSLIVLNPDAIRVGSPVND